MLRRVIYGSAAFESNRSAESAVRSWHIPRFITRLLPRSVFVRLLELKKRTLARTLPRSKECSQCPEDARASASMSIIVPIHDAPTVTRRCLASVEKYAPESEIILVDDASVLGETFEAIQHFSGRNGWKVIRHERSLGHSEACRAGASLASRPYLCLLNSDTVVTPWCWRFIEEAFDRDHEIGIAGPSTSNTGNIQSLPLPEFLSPYLNDNQICSFASRLLTQPQESALVDLEWISGNAFFIRRTLWGSVGGFDRNLPDYGNEIELCHRVAKKGYRLVWVRSSYIHHFGRQTYGKTLGDRAISERIRAAEIYIAKKKRSVIP